MFQFLPSSICTVSRPFWLLTEPHQPGGWRCRGVGMGTQTGQLTPDEQRHIPDHLALCLAYKGRGKMRKEGSLEWQYLTSQVTISCDGVLLSWEWRNTCLPVGIGKWIPCFTLLVYVFFFPYWTFLPQPVSFPTFLILSPSHWRGQRMSGHMRLSYLLELNHYKLNRDLCSYVNLYILFHLFYNFI